MKMLIWFSEAYVSIAASAVIVPIPLVSNHREVKEDAVLSCWMG